MKVIETNFEGLKVIETNRFFDSINGFINEAFNDNFFLQECSKYFVCAGK